MSYLFTGAYGFLGFNIVPQLANNGINVLTCDLSSSADFQINLANEIPLFNQKFDTVIHAAGKAHSIPKSKAEEQVFFDVNYQGTVNLCKGLEKSGLPKSFIFISTVAVYGVDNGLDITEEHPLNGDTPYALSKIWAEKYLIHWCSIHNVTLTILRPSLIAGPTPPGNLGAMIKGIRSGLYLSIAGGKARKSVLMVDDLVNLILLSKDIGGIYNVCDNTHPSFAELESLISNQLNKSMPISIPSVAAKVIAKVGDLLGSRAPINSLKLEKITQPLTFSNQKAKEALGWKPLSVLDHFKIY